MTDAFELETPEAVLVRYDIAGIGTRFLAAFIDILAISGLSVLIALGLLALAALAPWAQTLAEVLIFVLTFALLFGYYILFETIWSGQTPGKRGVDIRVLKTSGYPITFVDALIRNLMRLVDMLPFLYGVGVVAMFANSQSRRLGDLAAGTIVVKERARIEVDELGRGALLTGIPADGVPERTAGELEWNLRALTPRDMSVIRAYLDRADGLPIESRQRIGHEIAMPVADRIGAPHASDPVSFLQRILDLGAGE